MMRFLRPLLVALALAPAACFTLAQSPPPPNVGTPQPLSCSMVVNACGNQAFTRSALGTPAYLNGSGAPGSTLGAVGDYYMRTDNGALYQKIAGTWTVVVNLTGPQGPSGTGVENSASHAISSGTLTIDLSTGNTVFFVANNANITTFTVTGMTAAKVNSFTVVLTGDGTQRTQAGWSTVKWPSGIQPTTTATSGKEDWITFVSPNGSTPLRGFVANQNL